MTENFFYIILVSYAGYFIFGMRRYFRLLANKKKYELLKIQEQYEKLTLAKDDIYDSKLHVEDESMKTFTLFEITKDIVKSLNEEEAFAIFKQKLRDNVSFKECHYLAANDENIKKYRQDSHYFIYTIRSHRRKTGYLAIEAVKESDKSKMHILCHQYSLALRRVRLYQQIEKTAITDSLTGVYTRRYTLERLNEEIDRSKHRKMNFVFLMMDVDHFKKFNDQYGHLTGDQILREIGNLIKNNIREIDIPGRFGGEEFCVLLPDTDLEGARYAAERIRKAVETTQIQAYDNKVHVTISIGIAVYPRDATKGEELVDKADWTLYKAKKQGRNQVCFLGSEEGS